MTALELYRRLGEVLSEYGNAEVAVVQLGLPDDEVSLLQNVYVAQDDDNEDWYIVLDPRTPEVLLQQRREKKMEKDCDFINSVPCRLELIAAVCREAAESYRQGNKDEVKEALYYVEERVSAVWKLLRGDV